MSEYFPEEVIMEILKRLPLKSLVRCRSVCKSWNILIKTPSFISIHLQTSLSKPHSHLLIHKWLVPNDKETISFSLHFDNDDFDEFKQLHFPVAFNDYLPYFVMIGYCNGLVCFRCGPNMFDFVFWNPSIRKYIRLPPKPGITEITDLVYGFGFDSRTNDYKLLIRPRENIRTASEAYLFSLNENSWKRVAAISPEDVVPRQFSSTFGNGALHWLGRQTRKGGGFIRIILGFDLSTEEYFVISLPESLIGLFPQLSILKYDESSIALLSIGGERDEELDIWVRKKYGVAGSWTKVLHFTDQSVRIIQSGWGFRNNGEVLLEVESGEMVSLDLNCQQMKHLGIEAEYGFVSVDRYVESLVLLDK